MIIPKGWKLVPAEADETMEMAGRRYARENDPSTFAGIYGAMLAAAPTAPAGELRPDCSVCGDFGSDCGVCGAPSRQLVSDPDGLPGAKGYWLKDSGYGVDDHFDTLDEALSSASSLIEDYRTEAGADEWPSDADSITISAVTHVARFVHVRDNEYDLRMEAAAPAPDEREIAARAILDAVDHAHAETAVNRGVGAISESLVLRYAWSLLSDEDVLDVGGRLRARLRAAAAMAEGGEQ